MLKEDFVIQSQVRRILVRTNVDYSKISFGTIRGVVYFRGFFTVTRVYFHGDVSKDREFRTRDYTIKTLSSLEKKVRALPGVSDVIFQFSNWRKDRGQWAPVDEVKKRPEEVDEAGEEMAPVS